MNRRAQQTLLAADRIATAARRLEELPDAMPAADPKLLAEADRVVRELRLAIVRARNRARDLPGQLHLIDD